MATPASYGDLLSVLTRHEVEFMVVGGVAAILGGAPISTIDLDVLYRKTEVLGLDAVIESKEQANRPKDLAVLPVLRETLLLKGLPS
jgi:precorrin-2 methylase